MYLTRMELHRRNALSLMTSPAKLHGMVESAFPGERKRKLWRLDALGDRLYILILSEDKPELHNAAEKYAPDGDWSWQSKPYEPLLERVTNGSVWQFRLAANPTVSVPSEGKRGTIRACGAVLEQEKWLSARAGKHGFALREGEFRVVESAWHIFTKGTSRDRTVTLREASFEGLLTVVDEDEFKKTLVSGIGRGKAYGMGLLTIARPGM